MRCIKCGVDSNYKERLSSVGRCKNCGKEFLFEPKNSDSALRLTDSLFLSLLTKISSNEAIYYTQKQFIYALEKRIKSMYSIVAFVKKYELKKMNLYDYIKILCFFMGCLGIAIFVLWGINLSVFLGSIFLTTISLTIQVCQNLKIIATGIKLRKLDFNARQFRLSSADIQNWLYRWQESNGKITKLLPLMKKQDFDIKIDSDILNHSFDKLLVCETNNIAHFLIANNFHFENNCAVLSVKGYPKNIFDTMLTLVKSNPNLKVYSLHNCTPEGISLAHYLRTNQKWFLDSNITIYDIGLSPHHILRSFKFYVRSAESYTQQLSLPSAQQVASLPSEILRNLSPEEIEWLSMGLYVELESLTPKKLLRVISRNLKKTRDFETIEDVDSSDNWNIMNDDGEMIVGGSALIASDNFG